MSDPVEMRRALRLELRRLRNEAGHTQRQVADSMDWSASKVIRIENGQVAISVADLRALLAFYGVTSEKAVSELEELARNSKRQPFEQYKRSFPNDTVRYFEHERTAGTVRHFEPLVIPGLLQIESYTRALQAAYGVTQDRIDQVVDSRQDRQEVLSRSEPPPPHFVFLLDESAFWRAIGSPAIMERQLRHLIEVNRAPHIDVRIIPQSAGAYPGLLGSYVHIEFSGTQAGMSDVLYVESQLGDALYHEDSEIIELCLERFAEMEKIALDKTELEEFLTTLLASRWGWTARLPQAAVSE